MRTGIILIVLCVFMWGAALCSAIDCYLYRKKRNQKWSQGRSTCEGCGEELKAWQVVPVFGGLATKGKCTKCGYEFGIKYSIREAVSGILAVAILVGMYFFVKAL